MKIGNTAPRLAAFGVRAPPGEILESATNGAAGGWFYGFGRYKGTEALLARRLPVGQSEEI